MHDITWSVNSIRHFAGSCRFDPSAVVIAAPEKVGVARNAIRISPERRTRKVREAPAARAAGAAVSA